MTAGALDETPLEVAVRPVESYRGYDLDPFQVEAIGYLQQNHSVLVAAPTGVGKTLVADWLTETLVSAGKEVVYTAPIKALSNQKFREFKALLGEDAVGVITGDVVLNSEAPLRIMTTEIFRNMLHEDPERLANVSYVIFDEVHYLSDEDRGTIWEESLIFMPPHMRFLGLSATIPNAGELAEWIEAIKGQPVKVVRQFNRVVPLDHHLYERSLGSASLDAVAKAAAEWQASHVGAKGPTSSHLDLIAYLRKHRQLPCLYFVFSRRQCEVKAAELSQLASFVAPEVGRQIEERFDAAIARFDVAKLGMVKDLRRCLARGIAFHHAGLLPVLKEIVEVLFQERLISVLYCTETFSVGLNMPVKTVCFDSGMKYSSQGYRVLTTMEYFQMAGRAGRRGIDKRGYVYTLIDLAKFRKEDLPKIDEGAIEPLRSQFAVSYNSVLNLLLNYPEDEVEGLLGRSFASFQGQAQAWALKGEIAAMEAERAELEHGRCHLFGQSQCPLSLDKNKNELRRLKARLRRTRNQETRARIARKIASLTEKLQTARPKVCPHHQVGRCRALAKKLRKLSGLEERLAGELSTVSGQESVAEFWARRGVLQELGFIDHGEVTGRGRVAARIHVQELLVTELIFDGYLERLTENELNALAVSIDYELRSRGGMGYLRRTRPPYDEGPVRNIIRHLDRVEARHLGRTTTRYNSQLALAAYIWSQGGSFSETLRAAETDPGDVVHAFRRGIDLLRQIKGGLAGDEAMVEKLNRCIRRLDRDVVAVEL
ncbi:MAG: DEAD/DEAH box helicase [Chitinophagales bacterium]